MSPEVASKLTPQPSRFFSKISLVSICLIGAALIVIIRSAWVSDDAYITFRVVDNLWHGYGPRWNISERVCVYTNPLMMLSMSALYPFTHEFFYTSIFFSIAASIVAIGIVLRRLSTNILTMVYVCALLIASKAFIDYTTSGLEQCLTYLVAALFYALTFRRKPHSDATLLLMALVTGFAMLNRIDTILLFFPVLVLAFWHKRTFKRFAFVAIGFLPFVLWEAFSLIYYGSLLPNTYYAKLNSGLTASFYIRQGLTYYTNSLRVDPITLPTIVAAIVLCLRSKRRFPIAAAIGILLYLLYIIRVGGGFMSGRYFSAPFFCAVMLCCVNPPKFSPKLRQAALAVVAIAILLVYAFHPLTPLRSSSKYGPLRPKLQSFRLNSGIADERAYYYETTGLLRAGHYPQMPAYPWRDEAIASRNQPGYSLAVRITIGIYGCFAGPGIHIVDEAALADPFLARIPVPNDDYYTRIGHMLRILPLDYIKSMRTGKNEFRDPKLAKMYDAIRRIHSGPIWNRQRWIDIWAMHTYNRHGVPNASKPEDDKTIYYLNRIIELDSRRAGFYNKRGVINLRRAAHDQAIRDFDQAVKLNPKFTQAYCNRGLAHASKFNRDQAIRDYTKAIELNHYYFRAYNRRGLAYSQRGQHDQAISDFNEAIRLNPGFASAYFNRGTTYWKMGDREKGTRDLDTAAQLNTYKP